MTEVAVTEVMGGVALPHPSRHIHDVPLVNRCASTTPSLACKPAAELIAARPPPQQGQKLLPFCLNDDSAVSKAGKRLNTLLLLQL